MADSNFISGISDLVSLPGEKEFYHDYDQEVWDLLLGQRGEEEREKEIGMQTYIRGGNFVEKGDR
jgi:hypothetical protein